MATIIITKDKEELNIVLNNIRSGLKINENVNVIVADDKPKRKSSTITQKNIFERNKTDIIEMLKKRVSLKKIAEHYNMSDMTFRKYYKADSDMTNIRPPRKHKIKGVQQKLNLQ